MILVLNTNTLAVSTYSLTALDVIEYQDEAHFVLTDGLVKLATGAADATVETGVLSLGDDAKKYIAGADVKLSGDSTTTMLMTAELDGREVGLGSYDLPGRFGAASFVRQFKFAGGIKADSVSLKFESADGTAWALRGLVLQAASL